MARGRVQKITAYQHVRFARLGSFLHHQSAGNGLLQRLLRLARFGQLIAHRFEFAGLRSKIIPYLVALLRRALTRRSNA